MTNPIPDRVTSRVPVNSREDWSVFLCLFGFSGFFFLLFILLQFTSSSNRALPGFCDEFNDYIFKAGLFIEQKARRDGQYIHGTFFQLLPEFDQADSILLGCKDQLVSCRDPGEPPDDGLQIVDAVDMMITIGQLVIGPE